MDRQSPDRPLLHSEVTNLGKQKISAKVAQAFRSLVYGFSHTCVKGINGKIFAGEPEIYGLQRNVTVELVAWGDNTIRVQSVQEAWAIGKAEALTQHVHGFQRKLATQFRRFGLTFNVFILVAALAALPGLPTFWQRLAFLGSAFGIQALIAYFHRKYVPNFVFYPAKKKASWIGKLGPGFLSWGITIFGGVVAAIIYGILKGELDGSPLARFISGFFQ